MSQTLCATRDFQRRTPLDRQGWNVAERILAQRLVHFTDRQLVCECVSGCQHEPAKIINDQDSGPRINGYDKRLFHQCVASALLPPLTDIDTNKIPYAGEAGLVARLDVWTGSVNALLGESLRILPTSFP